MKKSRIIKCLCILSVGLLSSCGFTLDSESKSTSIDSPSVVSTSSISEKYVVKFDTNGGSLIDNVEVNSGEKLTKPADPTKEGYTFAGWYSSSSYYFEYNFNLPVYDDLTLYAKWDEIPKKVEYKLNEQEILFYTNSLHQRYVRLVQPVTNTGEAELYLEGCTFDIEDSSGKLLDSINSLSVHAYPKFLKPGETGYFYCTTSVEFDSQDVVIKPNESIVKAKTSGIRFPVTEVSFKDDMVGPKVIGRVENTSNNDESLVEVVVIIFDKGKKVINVDYTYLNNDLKAHQKQSFEISSIDYRNYKVEDIGSYIAFATPVQFNI